MKLIGNRKFMLVLATILIVSVAGFSGTAIASSVAQNETSKPENASLPVNINAINEDHTAVDTTARATGSVTQTEPTLDPTTQTSSDQHSTPDEQTKISVDQAKQIVLDKVPGATITEMELDNDDGRLSYKVEAFSGQTEYDFEIDAYTGAILEFESDKCVDKKVVTASTTQETTPSAQTIISVDQVKQIVLAKVPGATITESELDKDDGRLTYDVEAYNGQTEYDFEIDAYTGEILEFETDVDDEYDDLDEIDDKDEVDEVDEVDDEDEVDEVDEEDEVDEVDEVDED